MGNHPSAQLQRPRQRARSTQPKAKATANRPASFSSLADVERNARTEEAKRFGGPYRVYTPLGSLIIERF